jgi:hypothetical protein
MHGEKRTKMAPIARILLPLRQIRNYGRSKNNFFHDGRQQSASAGKNNSE